MQLAPGQEKKYSWGGMKASRAGTHTLTFSIHPHGSVDESNVKNNRQAVRVTAGE